MPAASIFSGKQLTEGPALLKTVKTSSIIIKSALAPDEKAEVKALIDDAFGGRKLVPGYFESGGIVNAFLLHSGEELKAAALLKQIGEVPYLDKFAIASKYQSNGVGKELLDALLNHYQVLALRTGKTNLLANSLYTKHMAKSEAGEWNVYHVGLSAMEAGAVAKVIASLPKTVV